MIQYLKSRIWDFILCTAISLGLVYPIFAGFLLKDSLSPNIPGVLALSAAVQLFLVFASYDRRMKIIGIVVGVVLLLVFVLASRSGNPFAHESSMSLAITFFIIILTGLLVFLATRTRPGTVVLFLLGFLVIAGSRFLQFPVKNWSFLLFLFCVFAMFWYRNYALTLMKVQMGLVQMRQYMLQTFVICLVGLGISGGIFAGIIRPLHPPTQQLKLITRLERMDMLKVMGVSTTKTILNPNLAADSRSDSSASGNKKKSTNAGNKKNQAKQSDTKSEKQKNTGAKSNSDTDSSRVQASKQMHYEIHHTHIPWVLIIIAIIIAAYFVLRMMSRRHWEKQVRALGYQNGIVNYYRFFLHSLSRCGFKKPENHTLSEYAANMDHEMQVFSEDDSTFSKLTEIYCRTVYGKQPVRKQEYQLFVEFYQNFRKNLRQEIGFFRFLGQYFFRSLV